ncbi:MAG: hypothetical protein K2Z81_08425 [Cyanobacteria bacterium]|nr:hypothetical protein [Cyanobacteriota bacterium]
MKKQRRKQNGNLLVIIVLIVFCVLVPLLIVQSQIGLFVVDQDRAKSVVEAASLVAANDLSKIVIDDSHFGPVSLSNYAPVGRGTCAADGEPMPVIGINTLVGTIRQNTIVAQQLGSERMCSLADSDGEYLKKTIKDLNGAMKDGLSGTNTAPLQDIYGTKVEPIKDVIAFLQNNLPKNMTLETVQLSCGWLKQGGGSTTIAIPKPERLAEVSPQLVNGGQYKPFIDIPAVSRPFTFAGLGPTSRLVPPADFQPFESKKICSIVRLVCTIKRIDRTKDGANVQSNLRFVSCSQPFSIPDAGPKGVMTVRFTGAPVAGLRSWSDFLRSGNFHDRQVTSYRAVNGDYPSDSGAHMMQCKTAPETTTAQFAEHLYYWLRNGNLRPRIDAVQGMVDQPFSSDPKEINIYEFANDGTISRRIMDHDPFPIGVTSDMQSSVTACTSTQSGLDPVIIFRNNVRYLGNKYGGKHAGQALAGNPLNWCESGEYGGNELMALGLGKGRLATKLNVINSSGDDEEGKNFTNIDGKELSLQPRTSYYSGGLAVDIEIGGTTSPAISARMDEERMRKLTR